MRISSQKRPEIIGAIRRRRDNHQPFSLVLGFRNCERSLSALMESLKDEFGDSSEILSNIPGHISRRIYRRDEPIKSLKEYPAAESINASTVATLDIWNNAGIARCCGYIPVMPPLLDIISDWSFGTHATLHVATCADFVLPGDTPTRDYAYSLSRSTLKSLKNRFLPPSHKRYAHNGYVLFQQPHS